MAANVRVRSLVPEEATSAFIHAWSELEARSIEPNAYLSPHFALPALRYLDCRQPVTIIAIETDALGGGELIGVGIFRRVWGTRHLPLPHLIAYQSRHSYLSGMLLDCQHADVALDAFFDYVRGLGWCQGVVFNRLIRDWPLDRLLTTVASQRGSACVQSQPMMRAILQPSTEPVTPEVILGPRKAKDLRRRRRRLEEQGRVGWQLHRSGGVPKHAVETFLDLEHQGWKAECDSSLRSSVADETFFREVVARFSAEERAFFTELSIDGKVIAATSNFVSGRAGFAFKLGWNASYAKISPGILNEFEFVRRFPNEVCSDLHYLDSGAVAGSYMEQVWPGRAAVHTWCCPLHLGKAVYAATTLGREIKRTVAQSRV
jgi:CelD/BcsL family acetyltransferase involved in cellulose biosynthesis